MSTVDKLPYQWVIRNFLNWHFTLSENLEKAGQASVLRKALMTRCQELPRTKAFTTLAASVAASNCLVFLLIIFFPGTFDYLVFIGGGSHPSSQYFMLQWGPKWWGFGEWKPRKLFYAWSWVGGTTCPPHLMRQWVALSYGLAGSSAPSANNNNHKQKWMKAKKI